MHFKEVFIAVCLVGCSSSQAGTTAHAVEGPAVGNVRFHVTNTTAEPVFAIVSSVDGAPAWLDVDAMTIATVPTNAALCGGDGTHDDPSYTTRRIDPGKTLEYVWGERTDGAARVDWNAARACTTITRVAAGKYSAHACFLTKEVSNANLERLHPTTPQKCLDAVADVPAAGETTVALSL
jgi:hypothetical protein